MAEEIQKEQAETAEQAAAEGSVQAEGAEGDTELIRRLESLLRDTLRFRSRVEILEPGSLARSDHKTRLLQRESARR